MTDDRAVLVRVADGITTALANKDFGIEPWEPLRSYAEWDESLKEMNVLHIDVVPVRHVITEMADRASVLYRCDCDIGIRKKLTPAEQTNCGELDRDVLDRLVLLVEQINEFFLSPTMLRLPTYEDAAWYATDIRASFVRKHLRDNGQFTGLIRSTYDVIKHLI